VDADVTGLHDILRNGVNDRLRAGEVAAIMSVRLISSVEIAQLIKSSGFDGFYVDLEHGALDVHHVGQICVAALGIGLPAFVRVPVNEATFISRVLDVGATGVHVPHVETAEDARRAVAAAKFPPFGGRSVSPTLPHLLYRSWPAAEARKRVNECTTVVAVIESQKGLDNAGEIAAVEGVDVLMIGTNDLCADWDLHGRFDHPRVEDAYRRVMEACARYGKHLGIGGLSAQPDLVRKYVELGGRYVMAGSDLQFFMKEAQERASRIRQLAGISDPPAAASSTGS
jgi:4-hydroxy-2-oxoheptanedioate aldolase